MSRTIQRCNGGSVRETRTIGPTRGPVPCEWTHHGAGTTTVLKATGRRRTAAPKVVTVSLRGAPGVGKTELLVRTLSDLGAQLPVGVITNDPETMADGRRIHATGASVVQVNTGSAPRPGPGAFAAALDGLAPRDGGLVFVEAVGGLTEIPDPGFQPNATVVVMSVTDDPDTPLKYPHVFAAADLVVVNKLDLLRYTGFPVDRCREVVRAVCPAARVITTSATRGNGMCEWYRWLLRPLAG